MLDYIKATKLEYKLQKLLKSKKIHVDEGECYFNGKTSYNIYYPKNNKKLIKKVNDLEENDPNTFLIIGDKHLKIYENKIEEFIKDIKMTKNRWIEVIANIIRDKYYLGYDLVSIHGNKLKIDTVLPDRFIEFSDIFKLPMEKKSIDNNIIVITHQIITYQIDNPAELYTLFKITGFIN